MTDKFLKTITKQIHILFLRPGPEFFPPLHLSHIDVHEDLPSFLEKGRSFRAPDLDRMAGEVRWGDPTSEMPPQWFARCEA
jgi:hypothetical protein